MGVRNYSVHEHHIWDLDQVRAFVADEDQPVTFLCGGSRYFLQFIDLFDEILRHVGNSDPVGGNV